MPRRSPKVERGHAQDVEDVEAMLRARLIEPQRVRGYFGLIEPELYRFPTLDPSTFRAAVAELFQSSRSA